MAKRTYTHLTKKNATAYQPSTGEPVALVWQPISPMTRDPTIRGSIPGEYAIVKLDSGGELVYIFPHSHRTK